MMEDQTLMTFDEWRALSAESRARINAYGLEVNALQKELAAWKAEAMAAREYIKLIEPAAREYAGREMFESVGWGYKEDRDDYIAARVKDDNVI